MILMLGQQRAEQLRGHLRLGGVGRPVQQDEVFLRGDSRLQGQHVVGQRRAARLVQQLATMPPALAQLFASIAASDAAHVTVLGG